MLAKTALNKIIFLNIDTVPQYAKFENVPENKKLLFKKRFNSELTELSKIAGSDVLVSQLSNEGIDCVYQEKAALYPEWGRIACISFLVMNEKYEYHIASLSTNEAEAMLLNAFLAKCLSVKEWKKSPESKVLCSYNGMGFTFPFLAKRFLINSLPLPAMFDFAEAKPWEQDQFIDLMALWKFNQFNNYTSLDSLAATFGVEYNDNVADVSRMFYSKELDKLKEYSMSRVITLATCYLRIKAINDNLIKSK